MPLSPMGSPERGGPRRTAERSAAANDVIHPLLAARSSPRAFSRRAVEPARLARLFEAARWAPSCFNEQPWAFVLATSADADGVERLQSCLVPGNDWARRAPVLVLTVCRTCFEKNGQPNPHAWHDVGMATQNLFLQVVEEGLVAHAMAGFDRERARVAAKIPEGFEPVALIALGYPASIDEPQGSQQPAERAPRQRRPLEEFVFDATWGVSVEFPPPACSP